MHSNQRLAQRHDSPAAEASVQSIMNSILILRGIKVVLDTDLASLYGATTKRFNEPGFPADFLLELTAEEFANLKPHSATSSWGGRRKSHLSDGRSGSPPT